MKVLEKHHKKAILLILAIVALTYANTLFNGFVGDDNALFVENSFYDSLKNIPRIFDKSYFTSGSKVFFTVEDDLGSGSVAYRPVLSLSYFLDTFLWNKKAFGYHLTNILLHAVNCLLLYFFVFRIFRNQTVALLSSLLFAAHPIQAEAICNIGFRGDLLSFLFFFVAFLFFLRARGQLQKTMVYLVGAGFFYCFAVFSKESAIVFPILAVTYDFYFREKNSKQMFSSRFILQHMMFALITVGYLFIYFKVFPNYTVGNISWFGGNVWTHILTVMKIFASYFMALFFPPVVCPLVSFYAPPVFPLWDIRNVLSVALFLGILLLAIKSFHRNKPLSFFIVWLLISFGPVANIIPNINPMAYRFMYLPSVGFFVSIALLIEKASQTIPFLVSQKRLGVLLKIAVVGGCSILTISLNGLWKNDFVFSSFLVKEYPRHPWAYYNLGLAYMRAGLNQRAIQYFEKSIEIDPTIPVFYKGLAVVSSDNPDRSIELFQKALELNPHYLRAHADLCVAYVLKKDYNKAVDCYGQIMREGDTRPKTMLGYIKLLVKTGQITQAGRVCDQAIVDYPGQRVFKTLKVLIEKE